MIHTTEIFTDTQYSCVLYTKRSFSYAVWRRPYFRQTAVLQQYITIFILKRLVQTKYVVVSRKYNSNTGDYTPRRKNVFPPIPPYDNNTVVLPAIAGFAPGIYKAVAFFPGKQKNTKKFT